MTVQIGSPLFTKTPVGELSYVFENDVRSGTNPDLLENTINFTDGLNFGISQIRS